MVCIKASNRTEWSAIRSEIRNMISDQNCTTTEFIYFRHFKITNLIASIQEFGPYQYYIDAEPETLFVSFCMENRRKNCDLEQKIVRLILKYKSHWPAFLQIDWLLQTSLEIELAVVLVFHSHWLGKDSEKNAIQSRNIQHSPEYTVKKSHC